MPLNVISFSVRFGTADDGLDDNGWDPDPRGDKIGHAFLDGATRVLPAEIVRDRFDDRWASDPMPMIATVGP